MQRMELCLILPALCCMALAPKAPAAPAAPTNKHVFSGSTVTPQPASQTYPSLKYTEQRRGDALPGTVGRQQSLYHPFPGLSSSRELFWRR